MLCINRAHARTNQSVQTKNGEEEEKNELDLCVNSIEILPIKLERLKNA